MMFRFNIGDLVVHRGWIGRVVNRYVKRGRKYYLVKVRAEGDDNIYFGRTVRRGNRYTRWSEENIKRGLSK